MYKRDIYLDIDDKLNEHIKSVELDSNSRVWHFHLMVDYEPLDLTGKSVHFRAEKPDKTNVLNDCKIVDAEKGVVEVKLTRQVNAIPGCVKCLLKIIGDEGFVLKTKTFVVDVSKTLSDDAIVSSDEFGALEAALGKVQDIDNRFAQTNAQLSQKANLEDIANISSGTPLFANSTIDMIDATRNYVNLEDGYLYIYSEDGFKKTDLKYQETGISDNSITSSKIEFINSSRQYLLYINGIKGKYYSRGSVSLQDNANTTVFKSIEIKKGVTYYYRDIYAYFSSVIYNDGTIFNLSNDISEALSGSFVAEQDGKIYVTIQTHPTVESNNYMGRAILCDTDKLPSDYIEGDFDINIPSLTNICGSSIKDKTVSSDKLNFVHSSTQYLEKGKMTNGYYYSHSGNGIIQNTNTTIHEPIEIKKGVTYYYRDIYAYFSVIKYNDGESVALSNDTSEAVSGSFIAEKDGEIYVTIHSHPSVNYIEKTAMLVDSSEFPDKYTEGSYALHIDDLIIDIGIKRNVITVKKDGTGDFTNVKKAIDSIKKSDFYNRYDVYIYTGEYDLVEEFGGQAWVNSVLHSNGERQGLCLPNYVNLIGVGNVVLKCEVPNENATSDFAKSVSTINVWMNNDLKNIKFTARNTRYVIHDETNNSFSYLNRHIDNCEFIHYGNKNGFWGMCKAMGGGTGSGGNYVITNSLFESIVTPFTYHNNNNQESNNFVLDGCIFKGKLNNNSVGFGYYKSNTNRNKVYLKNIITDGTIEIYNETGSTDNVNVYDVFNFTNHEIIVK